jgi:hypothetical protein
MFATATRRAPKTQREQRASDDFVTVSARSVDAAKEHNASERARIEAATGMKFDSDGRLIHGTASPR